MRRTMANSLLFSFLTGATLWTLVQSADLRSPQPIDAGSPLAVSKVRAYYLAVQSYVETGDMSGIRAVVHPSLLAGAPSDAGEHDLLLYLRGLRTAFPALRFAVEELTASNEIVVARISLDYGTVPESPFAPLTLAPARQQIDTFRVVDGSITEWSSTGAASGLVASDGGSDYMLEIHEPRRLVVARISFAAGSTGHVAIQAPALLIPERGSVQFRDTGLAVVSTLANPEERNPSLDGTFTVGIDESIRIPRGHIVLSAATSEAVSLIAVLFVPLVFTPPDHEVHAPYPPAEQLLGHGTSGLIGPGISIELLERADTAIKGTIQLVAGVALLEPGGGIVIQENLESVVVLPRRGSVAETWNAAAHHQGLLNVGKVVASAWIVGVQGVMLECVFGEINPHGVDPSSPMRLTC
ncbi:MAG: nuclear transport factor 2 family protein [Thermomicrobiales bacterium]